MVHKKKTLKKFYICNGCKKIYSYNFFIREETQDNTQ